jgi:hypothetical protein
MAHMHPVVAPVTQIGSPEQITGNPLLTASSFHLPNYGTQQCELSKVTKVDSADGEPTNLQA